MPTKKSTKTRKSQAEANGVHRRPKWEIEMERTIDEMVAPLEGDTTDSRANLRKLLRPSFEFANQYAVFKWHWEGKGKKRYLEDDGVVFHARDYKDVQKFLATIPDAEQQYYTVQFMGEV